MAQLLKEVTGATRTYEVDTAPSGELNDELTVLSDITGQVKLLRTGEDILVTGTLQATLQRECGRCLAQFAIPVSVELEDQFYPSIDVLTGAVLPAPADADESTRIDDHHILNLWEVARQEFVLAAEDQRYCKPDCKGLCPQCGKDRNVDPCRCADNAIDQRWAKLLSVQLNEDESADPE